MARNALGKGLGALIGGGPAGPAVTDPQPRVEVGEKVQELTLDSIVPSPLQPRKTFTEQELNELSDSIKEHGVIQPLIVRKVGAKYELIAGERRWRASTQAGLKQVPVIVRQAEDLEVLEVAMVENLQRADLNPVEEAEGYALLADRFKLTQDQIGKKVGKSRAAVANALRLTGLAKDVKELVRHRQLSVGHAKVILSLSNHTQQDAVAREVLKRDLSVRETEKLVSEMGKARAVGASGKDASKQSSKQPGADWRDLELRLQRVLGTKVRLIGTRSKGHLEIDYYNESDLERVLSVLGYNVD